MEYIVVSIVALLASGLTLFSGFGLGTILLPAFVLFFPAEIAVAMTAIVHFLNNLFKLALLGRNANWKVVMGFGIPAIVAAIGGAALLHLVSTVEPLTTYTIGGTTFAITSVKLLMALLIATFAILELIPAANSLSFDMKYLPLGGVFSGFFGGLSGHQGALRSAFLIRAGLSKEAFIATGVVIACLIDVSRLSVYAQHIVADGIQENTVLLIAATLSAFIGAYAGNRLLKKVTMKAVQATVAVLLFIIAALLGTGLI
ncbi:MAG: TSUP family transporter [Bacteroidetes bacterium]|nr:TSUP family transporter [Bacteroidota bacterium]MCW5895305.1 TSUP family transporter [Bacteroidota bacterium]